MQHLMKKKLRWLILPAVLLSLTAGTAVYTADYYHADETALKALESDGTVKVSETDYGWYFDGPSDDTAMVFYPGAKVEETAYAPFMHKLASEGIDACLVSMPLRLGVLDVYKAGNVILEYGYDHWYIAGHSLGGTCAGYYAAKHPEQLDGIILLASYTTKNLDENLPALLVYGSNDGVLSMKRYTKYLKNVCSAASEHVIQGGNHCQFGSYGFQKGDGKAEITPQEQIEETVRVIREFISENSR